MTPYDRLARILLEEDADALRLEVGTESFLAETRDWKGGRILDSLLHEASTCGRFEQCRVLVEAGADVKCVHDGYSPLLSAIENNHIDIVRYLLDQGADLHARGINGYDALGKAAVNSSIEIIEMLLVRGADIDTRTDVDGGLTPLMDAAMFNRPDVALLLLKRGADRSIQHDFGGGTAEAMARDQGYDHVADLIRDWKG